ncbi:MAG: 2-amino-4-hydroxy-6-hydroxymethyldihydropteridine diphosphokinase [Anaerolinea sp.]|nr:2-amino-4-hydroxy-6-hydroxymethyldihydropteridine diphosphokinase [Anaerolinea sp.]
MSDKTCVTLALGSNLGDRCANLHQAVKELSKQVTINKTSSIYETPPWGFIEQPVFLNQVIRGKTTLNPHELLTFIKGIEQEMGRIKNFINGPRLIDIDILLFGSQIITTADLVIPHPRMLERGFVLLPLAEIEPDLIITGTKNTVSDHLQNVDQAGIFKINPESIK